MQTFSRYSSLVGTIAKKFTKRQNEKPVDSDESEEGEIMASVRNSKKKRYTYSVTSEKHIERKQKYVKQKT